MRTLKSAVVAGLIAGLGLASAQAQEKKIAISMIVEVPQLLQTKDGILQGLAEKGYEEGRNLTVLYQNANGNMGTQQQIARKFISEEPDVIVPITTPTSQAMAAATSEIPIVFATVIDPVKARIISQYETPGGNVTGVSDRPPIGEQLDLIKEIVPDLKRLGFVYNPGLDSSLATLEWIKEEGAQRGIEIVEAAAPTTNEVIPAGRSLIGKVDAIYVPNDTTVVSALESLVKIGQDTDLPVFTGETRGVERGAVAAVGLNYTDVGRLAGHKVAQVLDGQDPGQIDAVIAHEQLESLDLFVNRASADQMGVSIPESVLERATEVFD